MRVSEMLTNDAAVIDNLHIAEWIANELPIRFFGDPVLHQPCAEFSDGDFGGQEMVDLSVALTDTLKKYRARVGTGRGLAANQIGVSRRMIAVWLGDEPEVFVNPEVVSTEGKGSYWESCLSGGSTLIGKVIRPWKGTFKYRGLQGEEHIINADEKQTRLFLHEMQHLDGGVCTELYVPGSIRFIRGGRQEVLGFPFEKME